MIRSRVVANGATAPASSSDSTRADTGMAAVAVAALVTAFMLEATRVFLSYTVFVVDQSERGKLAAIAFGVFLAFALGGVAVRVLGPRRAYLALIAALVVCRVALQVWSSPAARPILGAIVIVAWGWLLPLMLGLHRDAAALGFGAGLGLDLAIRIAFRTVDLPWMPDAGAHFVTAFLVVLLGIALARLLREGAVRRPVGPGWVASAPMLVVGPGLAVYHLITGNLGLAQVKADLSFPAASSVLALGLALGLIGGATVSASERSRIGLMLVGIVATAGGLWLFWQETAIGPAALVIGAAGATALVVAALRARPAGDAGSGIAGIVAWLTVGMVLHAAFIFLFFSETGAAVVLAVIVALLSLIGAGALWLLTPSGGNLHGPLARTVAWVLPLLAVVCASQWLRWEEPSPAGPLAGDFTAMTYNIQSGFSRDNHWSLEAIARTIEAQDADIVVLQEVSRGWVISAGVDEALWLSDRLEMPFVFGAGSGDGLWGNAILSRAPITALAVHHFTSSENLDRAVVEARLSAESGEIWVFGTHLDNPSGAGAVRLTQVNQLLDFWDGRAPALVLGDFNATPDSDVLATIAQAGFVDLGVTLGPDVTTSERGQRIDYILATSEIELREIRVPDVWTSDHRPVVADVTVMALTP